MVCNLFNYRLVFLHRRFVSALELVFVPSDILVYT